MKTVYGLLTLFYLMGSFVNSQAGLFEFEFEELAPGVWAGVRLESSTFPVMGNTTFVIGDRGVVVFDGGGVPAMAEQVINKIQSITRLPVSHVVISHWHGDHNFGIHRFADEFPGVQFIAHSFTERAMNGSPMDYIENYPLFLTKTIPQYQEIVRTGMDADGNQVAEGELLEYRHMIENAEEIGREFSRVRVTLPTLSFDDKLVIHSGSRRIEILYLGHGNTEGDLVMWLPDEGIVATGDLVVLPSPYAFNVPPRAWAGTLRRLNALDYSALVPGHGPVQTNTAYVDLQIDVATGIADQRDAMVAKGLSLDEIEEQLDFSPWEKKFTGGDAYKKGYYDAWFEGPLRKAAIKELSGKPMKEINPSRRKP